MAQTPAHRLAAAARARREELGLTFDDVVAQARQAGHKLGTSSYRNVEGAKGEAPRRSTLDAVDAGLRWPTGTAAGMIHGESVVGSSPVAVVTGDHQAVMVLIDCLTPAQRNVVFGAVREWVDEHPEYAEHLGVRLKLGDVDLTDDEWSTLGDFLSVLVRRREAV